MYTGNLQSRVSKNLRTGPSFSLLRNKLLIAISIKSGLVNVGKLKGDKSDGMSCAIICI
jgi:hypothetical protein